MGKKNAQSLGRRERQIVDSVNRLGKASVGLFATAILFVALVVTIRPISRTAPAQVTVSQAEASGVDLLGDPLPEYALLRLGTRRFRHPSSVAEIALSPDEKTIITAGGREIVAWDAATGKQRWRANPGEHRLDLSAASYGVQAVAFTPDGERFYTPGQKGEAIIWETATGRLAGPPDRAGGGSASSIDMTADGQLIALGSPHELVVFNADGTLLYQVSNNTIAPLDVDEGDRLGFSGHYTMGQFSPDGRVLAVVTSDTPLVVRLHDAQTGQEVGRLNLNARLVRLDFSPDGRHIAATERDKSVRLYNVATTEQIWSHVFDLDNPYENYTSAVAFHPDGRTIAVCATDFTIYLLETATGIETGRLVGHRWYPWGLAFTADGSMLYSSGWDGAIRRWNVAARKQLPLPEGVHATGGAAASPDGRTLAYTDDAGAIRLADAENGTEQNLLELPGVSFGHLRFSHDGRRLAGGGTAGENVHASVWDVNDGELLHRWDWPKGDDPHSEVEEMEFSSDGSCLAAAVFRHDMAYLWDVATGEAIARLPHQRIYGLSFSPDGQTLATAGWDSIVRFWAVKSGVVQREFAIGLAEIPKPSGDLRMYTVRYSPFGDIIATAHLDGKVRIWSADDMDQLAEFEVDGRFIFGAMTFSPDGLWLTTGSARGDVAVWDPLSAQQVWSTGKHEGYVYTVDFGRDSRTLLSGGNDGICYLWNLRPEEAARNNDTEQLVKSLFGENSVAAYRAMWALTEMPGDAVYLFTTRRLQNRLANLPPGNRATAARRAVSVLAKIGTAGAFQLLEEWSRQDANESLRQSAAAALKRLSRR